MNLSIATLASRTRLSCSSMDQVSKRVFRNLVEPTWLALRICLAFIHSDFKTIVVPVFVYGCMAASPLNINLRVLPRLIIWIVSHLLQFCAANQAFSAEEDALNKPYRPVPAGLISSRKAYILRWFLVPFCLTLSHVWGITHAGISLAISFLAYNELGLDSYWYTKSFMNAVGIVSWNIGAAQIMRGDFPFSTPKAWIAPYMSVALIWTTMHIQDFRDYAGDRLQGRITVPILLPEWSRRFTPVQIVLWSYGLMEYWNVNIWLSVAFVCLGVYLALRIYFMRTEIEDKVSLQLYMLWLTMAQVSPFHETQ